MKRLSFIVPCYNVERYVENCLRSILACSLPPEEYEVICVNDCSLDSTSTILHRMAAQYSQIHVLDLPHNVGMGEGRNIALNVVNGNYIWFVDSDDAIVSGNVLSLLTLVEQNYLDVLAFNFDRLDEDGHLLSECRVFPDSVAHNGISFVKDMMGESFYHNIGYVWRFLYRLEYLKEKGLSFSEGVCWEDTVYTPKSIIEADRIASSSLNGYQYYFHQSSVCRVMEKQYPGKLIFDYVFHAGADLLHYAETIKDKELNDKLVDFTNKVYLKNNFALYMLRTTREERKNFYQGFKTADNSVRSTKNKIRGLGKWFLIPILGAFVADGVSTIYKLKKRFLS